MQSENNMQLLFSPVTELKRVSDENFIIIWRCKDFSLEDLWEGVWREYKEMGENLFSPSLLFHDLPHSGSASAGMLSLLWASLCNLKYFILRIFLYFSIGHLEKYLC